jgi:hypothetical protein
MRLWSRNLTSSKPIIVVVAARTSCSVTEPAFAYVGVRLDPVGSVIRAAPGKPGLVAHDTRCPDHASAATQGWVFGGSLHSLRSWP